MISPFVCKVSNATFSKPCTVTTCIAHMSNLNASGTKAVAITNCAHVDFNIAGFSESLDYAVLEQGFVGFRDLQYMSSFLGVNSIQLRDLYPENVEMLKRAIALLWAVKNDVSIQHCERCGHPTKAGHFYCTSSSMCNERQTIVAEILTPFLPSFREDEIVKAYSIIWRALTEKFTPELTLTTQEIESLKDLRENQ